MLRKRYATLITSKLSLSARLSTVAGENSKRVTFFGTDEFSLFALEKLVESSRGQGAHPNFVKSLQLVCPAPRPSGRGLKLQPVPTMALATKENIPITTIPYGTKSLKGFDLSNLSPSDIGVVVSFGYFIPPHILNFFPNSSMVNIHPSLLPKYRGAAPIEHALLNGDTETGVSIITIHEKKFDSGNILASTRVSISQSDTYVTLMPKLASVGSDLLLDVLVSYEDKLRSKVIQVDENVVLAPKTDSSMGKVRWDSLEHCSIAKIFNQFRAFNGSFGTYTFFSFGNPQGVLKRVVLTQVSPFESVAATTDLDRRFNLKPGSLYFHRQTKQLLLKCSDGWLKIDKLQVDSRRECSGLDFVNGYGLKEGISGEESSRFDLYRFL
jgi:methionyl-tRNA formyltransferase